MLPQVRTRFRADQSRNAAPNTARFSGTTKMLSPSIEGMHEGLYASPKLASGRCIGIDNESCFPANAVAQILCQ